MSKTTICNWKGRRCALLLALLMGAAAIAQAAQITGTVTDAQGKPVAGASVVVKGTTVGTATDASGSYEIPAPDDAVLTFSFLGMAPIDVSVNGKTHLNVRLAEGEQEIQEVVVTGLGIQRQSKSVGYAVSSVSTSNVQQRAEPDALRAIEGKIPGVSIAASSGAAGSSTRITIRGNSSFYGNNQPLFVVDGIPYSNVEVGRADGLSSLTGNAGAYGNSFSTLDPNDIESMSVLKGAAAAALYGSRAAGGVILVTTKSGSKAKRSQKGLEVSIAASVSFENIANLPEYQNKFGQGSNFLYSNANGSWGPEFSAISKIPTYDSFRDGIPGIADSLPYQAYPDNVKNLFNLGVLYDNSVSVSSANDKGVFNITVSDLRQNGYIPDSKFDRTSFSVGGNTTLENKLRFGGKLSYTASEQVGGIFGGNQFSGGASSFARTLILPRNYNTDWAYEGINGEPLFFSPSQADNPLWSTKHNTITTTMDRIVSSVSAGYSIFDWLSVDYQFGINQYSQDRTEIIDLYSRGAGGKGRIIKDFYRNQEMESNLMLTFNKMIANDFSVKAVAGHNVNQRYITSTAVQGNDFNAPGVFNVYNTVSQSILNDGSSKRRLWALYADVALGYKSWLFLNLTGRNDWSSTLPTSNNSYFYPAVASSFVFSEAFGIQNNIFSMGRLRLSYAMVGNDASPYYVNGTYLLDDAFNGQPTLSVPTTSYDPNLKPEFTKELEAGAELGFIDNRVNVDVTVYQRKTTDQIAPLYLPASTGTNRLYTNFGEVDNTGVEIALNATPVQLSNSFTWEISGTFTKNESEVVALTEGVDKLTLSTGCSNCPSPTLEVGKPYGVLQGTKYARDDKGNLLIEPNSGMIIAAKETGDLGNPYPDYIFSTGTTLKYKGFFLSGAFDGSVGGVLWSNTLTDYLGRGVTKDTEDRYGVRVIPGVYGDPNSATPILDAGGNTIPNSTQISEADLWFSGGGYSSFAINGADEAATYDATVFRIRDITLGYEFPKSLLKKTPLGAASISFTARNLWFYAPGMPKYTNYDPVVNTFGSSNIQGIDYGAAPSVRRYGINLKITF
jgi:TonB-linked SusC/RagA family outer membrane protein